jgi:sigma-B regulation protein RsbU (phosphoserine phosphatase)
MALGFLPQAEFPVAQLTMSPGTTLVLYSDGVTEAFSAAGDEFGEAGLLRVAQSHISASAATLCDAVLEAVRHHSSGIAADDITVLALKRAARP